MSELTYPHVVQQQIRGLKGLRCEVLRTQGIRVQVQFEDGTTAVLSRFALRRFDSPNRAALRRGDGTQKKNPSKKNERKHILAGSNTPSAGE
jgi:hypothetical protein